jgi:hypothetical protein
MRKTQTARFWIFIVQPVPLIFFMYWYNSIEIDPRKWIMTSDITIEFLQAH